MTTQIGFIGLGVMGTPMAESLARADFGVTAFDIDTTKVTQLTRRFRNIKAAASPRQVASRCGIVITMLPSGEYVRDVALGSDGLMHGFEGGELLIDASSCEPWLTLETAAALAKRGVAMVDSPTSGAEAGAKTASLVFMTGGDAADVARAKPVLDAMGKQVFHLGPLGAGHAMKSINNLVTAMTFLATAEGLALGVKLGLDPDVMTDVMNVCTSESWITRTHIKQHVTNGAFDDAFKLALMVKDIGIALELADTQRVTLPLSEVGQRFWRKADAEAGPNASVSELVRWVERITGVEIRS